MLSQQRRSFPRCNGVATWLYSLVSQWGEEGLLIFFLPSDPWASPIQPFGSKFKKFQSAYVAVYTKSDIKREKMRKKKFTFCRKFTLVLIDHLKETINSSSCRLPYSRVRTRTYFTEGRRGGRNNQGDVYQIAQTVKEPSFHVEASVGHEAKRVDRRIWGRGCKLV